MSQPIDFINALRRLKNDRGRLAELRRGLSETTRPSAWPALVSLGGQVDNIVDMTIAGLYALHPEETSAPNLGATWRELRRRNRDNTLPVNDNTRTSFEHRFIRLLSCQTKEELCEHLRPFVIRAKSEGLGINYDALYMDASYWENPKTRLKWAKEYWSNSPKEEPLSNQSEVL